MKRMLTPSDAMHPQWRGHARPNLRSYLNFSFPTLRQACPRLALQEKTINKKTEERGTELKFNALTPSERTE